MPPSRGMALSTRSQIIFGKKKEKKFHIAFLLILNCSCHELHHLGEEGQQHSHTRRTRDSTDLQSKLSERRRKQHNPYLVGAAVDAVDSSVGKVPRGGVLEHEAVATVQLHALVRHTALRVLRRLGSSGSLFSSSLFFSYRCPRLGHGRRRRVLWKREEKQHKSKKYARDGLPSAAGGTSRGSCGPRQCPS